MATLFEQYKTSFVAALDEELSLDEYLDLCKRDPEAYATPAERMLAAIGEPEIIDTRNDPRLSRLFSNRVIKRYPAFAEFYGLDDVIAQIRNECIELRNDRDVNSRTISTAIIHESNEIVAQLWMRFEVRAEPG